jgi:hypothetical protein
VVRCEFGQNEVPIVRGHGRTASDGRYRTLEFEGEADHRLVRSLAVRRSRSGSIGGRSRARQIEPRFIFRVAIVPEPASKGGVEILSFRVRTGNNLYSYPSVSPRGGVIIWNINRKR